MVRGLDIFRDHFRPYVGQYVLIGGTACDLLMEAAGLPFRATKDLDIVLYVEALDRAFVRAFWEFVHNGGYKNKQTSSGKKQYYRFSEPQNAGYPFMMELFTRKASILEEDVTAHLTPIPLDENIVSLSAIILNEPYYEFLRAGGRIITDIPIIGPEHLIPLKMLAWLDLTKRKVTGEEIDGKNIKKHKNDVLRLYRLLDPGLVISVPQAIQRDIEEFLESIEFDEIDLKNLGIMRSSPAVIREEIRRFYIKD